MLHCQRDAFQLPADAHYLNCAFMSPLMRSVENAGVEGIRQKRNPADIRPADFFDEVNRVRGLFAQLIKAGDPTRVAVVPSASYGLTAAARNLPMAAGQTVVVAAGQMPSNMYCWRRIATERQGHVYTVAAPVGGDKTFTEDDKEFYHHALKENFAVSPIQWHSTKLFNWLLYSTHQTDCKKLGKELTQQIGIEVSCRFIRINDR